MTVTPLELPWEVHTPRGKANALLFIDYAQESYGYFLTAARGTGEFWIYRNDKVQLAWNETTGVGRRPEDDPMYEECLATQGEGLLSERRKVEEYRIANCGQYVVNQFADWFSLSKEQMIAEINKALATAWTRGYEFRGKEDAHGT